MKMRGVRSDATLTSSAYRGIYENKEEKESIMAMIRRRTPETSL
jgi:GTP cyclohydrolase I